MLFTAPSSEKNRFLKSIIWLVRGKDEQKVLTTTGTIVSWNGTLPNATFYIATTLAPTISPLTMPLSGNQHGGQLNQGDKQC